MNKTSNRMEWRGLIIPVNIITVFCCLIFTSCRNNPSLQKPQESIVYDEASGFTLIYDTLHLDLTKFVDVGSTQLPVIETIVNQRGQYKILVNAIDSIDMTWNLITTTLTEHLEPLYDVQPFYAPQHAILGYHTSLLNLYVDATQNYALILPYDSLSKVADKRVCTVLWNSETNVRQFCRYRDMPCYRDDSLRAEYNDVGEFGQYLYLYSADSTRYNCIYMPFNRLLRWHGVYYGIASSDIFKVVDSFAEGTVRRMPNEGRWYGHDSVYADIAVSVSSLQLNNSWLSNAYSGWCDKDTVYQTAFIHDDKLYIVESRPDDGLYLMQLDDDDQKREVLRICDLVNLDERFNTKYVNLYPSSYSILQFREYNNSSFEIVHQGFIEFRGDTIRVVHFN